MWKTVLWAKTTVLTILLTTRIRMTQITTMSAATPLVLLLFLCLASPQLGPDQVLSVEREKISFAYGKSNIFTGFLIAYHTMS